MYINKAYLLLFPSSLQIKNIYTDPNNFIAALEGNF